MFTVNYLEKDPQSRALYIPKLAEHGITVLSEEVGGAANLVVLEADETDFEERVEKVRKLREQFPDLPIAVISRCVTVLFIYEIAQMADGVFSKQDIEEDAASWEDFAQRLQRVVRS